MRHVCTFIGLGVLLSGGLGCQRPADPVHQTAALVTISDAQEFDRLWDNTVDVLRRYHFIPDRQDRSAGVLTTHPVTSAHWFEIWRQDVTTKYAFAESNLANVRRSAEISFDATEVQDEYVLAVRVDVERLSSPERQVNSSAGAYQMFGTTLPLVGGQSLRGNSPDRWLPEGRDASLESTILARIIDRHHPEAFEYVEYAVEPVDIDADGDFDADEDPDPSMDDPNVIELDTP